MARKSIFWLLLLGIPAVPWADVVPLGDEQVLGTAQDPDHFFYSPDSAAAGDGFVVTWSSGFIRYFSSDLLDWGAGVEGRRIAADGRPGARLTLVPEGHKLDMSGSAVAADRSGRFAVVWNTANEHHPHTFLWLRQFSPAGAAVSTVRLAQTGPGFQPPPPVAVAMSPLGRALAVWGRPPTAATTPWPAGLAGQLFLPAGVPFAPPFGVTARPVSFVRPALGTDARGNAVLVYESPAGTNRSNLLARLYDRNGQPRGGEVRLATLALPSSNSVLGLGVQANGRFALAWEEAAHVRARLFDPSARPLGPAFELNSGRGFLAFEPDCALAPDGRLLAAWVETPPGGGESAVWARAFDTQGEPEGDAFLVGSGGLMPTVSASAGGTFLIAWERADAASGLPQMVSHLYGDGSAPAP